MQTNTKHHLSLSIHMPEDCIHGRAKILCTANNCEKSARAHRCDRSHYSTSDCKKHDTITTERSWSHFIRPRISLVSNFGRQSDSSSYLQISWLASRSVQLVHNILQRQERYARTRTHAQINTREHFVSTNSKQHHMPQLHCKESFDTTSLQRRKNRASAGRLISFCMWPWVSDRNRDSTKKTQEGGKRM